MRCFNTLPFPIVQSENLVLAGRYLHLLLLLYHIPRGVCEREFTKMPCFCSQERQLKMSGEMI